MPEAVAFLFEERTVASHAALHRTPYSVTHCGLRPWCQTRASFALSGIELTDDDAERAGRLLAGVISFERGLAEIRHEAGLQEE